MKHKAEQLWNEIWTSQATPCSLYFGKKRVSMWLIEITVSLEWKVPGWLPDFLSVLVFFAESISKALLTVVGRVVHNHVFFHSPGQEYSDTLLLAHTCELWAVTVLLPDGTLCLMCTAQWLVGHQNHIRSSREVGCNWAAPMQAASRMMLIEDIVLDDSLNVHCCLHYFPPHETFFRYGNLSITIVSTTNIIPTSTMSGLQHRSGSWIYLLTKVCPSYCFFITCSAPLPSHVGNILSSTYG